MIQGVVGVLLQFGTLFFLARLLETEVFGAMAILLIVQGIATLFAQTGLSSALIQRARLTESVLDSLFWLNVGLGIVVSIVLFLAAPLISALFDMPELRETSRAIGATFCISCWSIQYQALARKLLKFRRITSINILALLVTGVVSVLLAWSGFGLWALVLGVVIASVVRSAGFIALGIRDHGVPALRFDWSEVRQMVVFGAHRLGAMLANELNSRIDQLLVGGMLGAQALGFYSIAIRIVVQPIDLTNPAVTRVAFPLLSRYQDDDDRLNRTYLEIVGLVTAANAPILVAVAVLADWYIPVLLGSGWESVILPVQILASYALLRSIINAGSSLILAKGRADWTLYWNLFLLLLYPPALYTAALFGDVVAIAMTLAGLQTMTLFLYHRALIQPLTGIGLATFMSEIVKPVSCAIGAGVVAYATIGAVGRTDALFNVCIGAATGAVAYGILAKVVMPGRVASMRRIVFSNR